MACSATAEGSRLVAAAISKPGGQEAMNLQLVGSYINRVSALLEKADVSVVPGELAKMEGYFAGIDQVAHTLKDGGQ